MSFQGFKPGTKGYILYDLQIHSVFISRNTIFYEHIFPYHSISHLDFSDISHDSFAADSTFLFDIPATQEQYRLPFSPLMLTLSHQSHLILQNHQGNLQGSKEHPLTFKIFTITVFLTILHLLLSILYPMLFPIPIFLLLIFILLSQFLLILNQLLTNRLHNTAIG